MEFIYCKSRYNISTNKFNEYKSFRYKVLLTMFDLQCNKNQCNGLTIDDIVNDMCEKHALDGDVFVQVYTTLQQLLNNGIIIKDKKSDRYKVIGLAARVINVFNDSKDQYLNDVPEEEICETNYDVISNSSQNSYITIVPCSKSNESSDVNSNKPNSSKHSTENNEPDICRENSSYEESDDTSGKMSNTSESCNCCNSNEGSRYCTDEPDKANSSDNISLCSVYTDECIDSSKKIKNDSSKSKKNNRKREYLSSKKKSKCNEKKKRI